MRRSGRWGVLFLPLGLVAALQLSSGTAPAAPAGGVSLDTVISGSAVSGSSSVHPTPLEPGRPAAVDVTVSNATDQAVDIRSVAITGEVVGLSFFSYDTSVDLNVPAGATSHLDFALDLSALSGQATGLIPGSVKVVDSGGHVVATQALVADVHGSIVSVYGLFGLAVLVLTAMALAEVILAVRRNRMPRNRWRRGTLAMMPGLGIALVLVFTSSVLGLWVPSAGTWLPIVVILAGVFFAAGYLAPAPPAGEDDDEDDEDDDEDGGDEDGVGGASRVVSRPGPAPGESLR
ncbi:MAG: hypothetical protein ACRDY0_04965 [Acidimicrobiales bacterium]